MVDTDFPAITPGKQFLLDFLPQVPVTEKPKGYFREDLQGFRSASMTTPQTGEVGAAQQYGQSEGGPIFGETVIAGSPSFDIPPDINSPIVDRWIKENGQLNPNLQKDTMEKALERARALRGRLLKGA